MPCTKDIEELLTAAKHFSELQRVVTQLEDDLTKQTLKIYCVIFEV